MHFIYYSILLSSFLVSLPLSAMCQQGSNIAQRFANNVAQAKENSYRWRNDLESVEQLEQVQAIFEHDLPSEFLPAKINTIWADGQTILDHVLRDSNPDFFDFVVSRGADKVTKPLLVKNRDEELLSIKNKESFNNGAVLISSLQQERIRAILRQLVPILPSRKKDAQEDPRRYVLNNSFTENVPKIAYPQVSARQERWERRSLANMRRNERVRFNLLKAFIAQQNCHEAYEWLPPF